MHEQEKRFKDLMARYQREMGAVIQDEVDEKIEKPQSLFVKTNKVPSNQDDAKKRSKSVIQSTNLAASREEDLKLPQLTKKMMRDMDEKFLNKKIFQPLTHLDVSSTTGIQKYYNDYFGESSIQGTKMKPRLDQTDGPGGKYSTLKKGGIYSALGDDPIFRNLGGGKVDIIDKMRYLSKKELAKHNAIKRKQDFSMYEAMDLKNENEITIKDIGASDDDQDKDYEKMSDDEGIDDLYEFWEEKEKERTDTLKERNPNID